MKKIIKAKNREQFRDWLINNHCKEKECWVEVKIGNPTDDNHLWYLDAVEESLCFGWIDSTKKKVDGVLIQRFSPRKKNSNWSEINKERYRRLEKLNLVTTAGKESFSYAKPFSMDSEINEIINSDPDLCKKFYSFPRLYQKIRIDSIQREKKHPEIYSRMIKNFIKMTKEQKMYGQWNDYGRLYKIS